MENKKENSINQEIDQENQLEDISTNDYILHNKKFLHKLVYDDIDIYTNQPKIKAINGFLTGQDEEFIQLTCEDGTVFNFNKKIVRIVKQHQNNPSNTR